MRPYVEDLDSLPFPDRALVYERDPIAARGKIKHFLTGRGCPYNCTYCFNHALSEIYRGKGQRFRQRSVDNVIEEVRWVRDHYPLEFVVFVDDTFVLSKPSGWPNSPRNTRARSDCPSSATRGPTW